MQEDKIEMKSMLKHHITELAQYQACEKAFYLSQLSETKICTMKIVFNAFNI